MTGLPQVLNNTTTTETEEQNSNGRKLLVNKDAMLDSHDARERSYVNSANGINFRQRYEIMAKDLFHEHCLEGSFTFPEDTAVEKQVA